MVLETDRKAVNNVDSDLLDSVAALLVADVALSSGDSLVD